MILPWFARTRSGTVRTLRGHGLMICALLSWWQLGDSGKPQVPATDWQMFWNSPEMVLPEAPLGDWAGQQEFTLRISQIFVTNMHSRTHSCMIYIYLQHTYLDDRFWAVKGGSNICAKLPAAGAWTWGPPRANGSWSLLKQMPSSRQNPQFVEALDFLGRRDTIDPPNADMTRLTQFEHDSKGTSNGSPFGVWYVHFP